MKNKHIGSDFDDHLIQNLKGNDQLVFLHIREALENPDLHEDHDYAYLMSAIQDVARARGKSDLAEKAGLSRQALHKILNGKSIPSIQNVMAILNAVGLRFSVAQVRETISADEPASVLDVAEYALKHLQRSSTFMKLQKVVYYAHAESLVHYGKPLFKEPIEAWAAGPVIRELYEKHKGLKYIAQNTLIGNASNLSLDQKVCVDWALEKYGKLDGDTLSHLTHIEEPWKKARCGLSENEQSDRRISDELIRNYYSNLPNYSDLDDQ